jgi:hypothetical protein
MSEPPLSLIGEMLGRLRGSPRIMTEDERSLVTDELFWEPDERGADLARFFVLIVLSTLLAAFGLAANSVAVIIGAMLVAPLMTPILGTAASPTTPSGRQSPSSKAWSFPTPSRARAAAPSSTRPRPGPRTRCSTIHPDA